MKIWKKNLLVCWFGVFVTNLGTSQIAPVLPLYIKSLGIHNVASIERFSGIAFGVTFVISAIFSPIWGKAADKVGRKPMLLRASLGMAIVIFSFAFARNVYQLIGLRALQGTINGYTTACLTLIAVQTDKEHSGWALGTLSTASVSGSLLGPMLGGYIEETLNLQYIFFITGGLLIIAFFTALFFVKEDFKRSEHKDVISSRKIWNTLPSKSLFVTLFLTTLISSIALYSIEPVITVYVSSLMSDTPHLALFSGIAFSASGLASIISAPRLGKLSDKIGPHKVMFTSLIMAAICFIPQAFVRSPLQLTILRFLLGLSTAGIIPSINTLVKKNSPDEFVGRIFGYNMSGQYLGICLGSILGGQISALFGIRNIFFITSFLLLINALSVHNNLYKKLKNV